MSVQQIVDPSKIEVELLKIWDELAKEKTRACLFNLIVYNRLSERTDYIRDIVKKVSEKYPCRVLFVTFDPEPAHNYLKTAVSVVGACDYIDIGAAGTEMEKVPFLLTPHIVPDLPVSLLWTEDPSQEHSLFDPLSKLANRIIFDSESADSLLAFSKKVLSLKQKTKADIADLNWARTEGWRDLLASLFHSGDKLNQIKTIRIIYNARPTEFFCHLKVQSLYLLAWFSSRLNWKFQKATPQLDFHFENKKGEIRSTEWEKLGPGTIISVDITTEDEHLYHSARIPSQYHYVNIQISSLEKCELPFQYLLGRTATGQSLVNEIIMHGTSQHYLDMLQNLTQLDRDRLC